jgi:hypothetical protein
VSEDEKGRYAMRWFAESQRQFRCTTQNADSNFLNWKDEAGEKETAALVARTRKTCKKMEVELKLNEEEDCMIVKSGKLEFKRKTAVGIGRFPIQKLIRINKIQKLI